MPPLIRIFVNERPVDIPGGMTLEEVRAKHKPSADVVVVNGFPCGENRVLTEGDRVVFIQRGETPCAEEFEDLMMARHTPGVHKKLKGACVGIAGLGGLGSAVAVALARAGVGKLVLVDFDVVEPSNLNRQQYFTNQIGQFKTDALANTLRRILPSVRLVLHTVRLDAGNVAEMFKNVDVLVEAFDTAEGKAMLVESFKGACPEKPIITASGLAGHGPGNSIQVRRMGRGVYVVGDLETAAGFGTGLMAPRVGIAAHHQANAVMRLLLGEEPGEA